MINDIFMGIANGMGFLLFEGAIGKRRRNLEFIVMYYGCVVQQQAHLSKVGYYSVSGFEIMHRCILNNPNRSNTRGNGRNAMERYSHHGITGFIYRRQDHPTQHFKTLFGEGEEGDKTLWMDSDTGSHRI